MGLIEVLQDSQYTCFYIFAVPYSRVHSVEKITVQFLGEKYVKDCIDSTCVFTHGQWKERA